MKTYEVTTRHNGVYVAKNMTGPVNAVLHTAMKWMIPETDILSVVEVDENGESLYTCTKSNLTEDEIEVIMEQYQCVGSYENGGVFKKPLPDESNYRNLKLEDIPCPVCGEKSLEQTVWDTSGLGPDSYGVACDDCEFICPIELSDCGETIVVFKQWLAIYKLLGYPQEYRNRDLTLFLYPKGEWRDKERNYRIKEGWYNNYCEESKYASCL